MLWPIWHQLTPPQRVGENFSKSLRLHNSDCQPFQSQRISLKTQICLKCQNLWPNGHDKPQMLGGNGFPAHLRTCGHQLVRDMSRKKWSEFHQDFAFFEKKSADQVCELLQSSRVQNFSGGGFNVTSKIFCDYRVTGDVTVMRIRHRRKTNKMRRRSRTCKIFGPIRKYS